MHPTQQYIIIVRVRGQLDKTRNSTEKSITPLHSNHSHVKFFPPINLSREIHIISEGAAH